MNAVRGRKSAPLQVFSAVNIGGTAELSHLRVEEVHLFIELRYFNGVVPLSVARSDRAEEETDLRVLVDQGVDQITVGLCPGPRSCLYVAAQSLTPMFI